MKKFSSKLQVEEQQIRLFAYLDNRTRFLIDVCKNKPPVGYQMGVMEDCEIMPNRLSIKVKPINASFW